MLATIEPEAVKPRMAFNYPEFAEFMRKLGFDTPAKIAAELGVHKSVISKLENGLQRPSIDFIALLWVKYPRLRRDRFLSARADDK